MILLSASKRDGGVLSEQDIATWVEELVFKTVIIIFKAIPDNVSKFIDFSVRRASLQKWECLFPAQEYFVAGVLLSKVSKSLGRNYIWTNA